jgi:acyl-CoA thioesterase 8
VLLISHSVYTRKTACESMLLKRASFFNTIIYRCLSSEKSTLHETLKVHQTTPDVFVQPVESLFVYPHRTSVFGGQIIGSAMYAAQQTLVKDFPLHSLHSYFLAAADNSSPITYTVQRLRDGKSFETRSVTARQDEKIIFQCEMSFHRKENGSLAHQPIMPDTGK